MITKTIQSDWAESHGVAQSRKHFYMVLGANDKNEEFYLCCRSGVVRWQKDPENACNNIGAWLTIEAARSAMRNVIKIYSKIDKMSCQVIKVVCQ